MKTARLKTRTFTEARSVERFRENVKEQEDAEIKLAGSDLKNSDRTEINLNRVFTMEKYESPDRPPPMQTKLPRSHLKNSDCTETNLDRIFTMEEEESPDSSPDRRHPGQNVSPEVMATRLEAQAL